MQGEHDRSAIEAFCEEEEGLPVAMVVPYDEAIRRPYRAGHAPIDTAPDAPAVRAIGDLANGLH